MMPHPTEVPLRVMVATAPSGGEIRFVKRDDSPSPSLSFYRNLLTADEDRIWWLAKLAAEKPGIAAWEKAMTILINAHWKVSSEVSS